MMSNTVNIQGLDRADVLASLYNNSQPLGMGVLHYDPEPMKCEEAAQLLEEETHFDYVKGRVMKVHLKVGESSLDPSLYDRDNWPGAAQRAIDLLRAELAKEVDDD